MPGEVGTGTSGVVVPLTAKLFPGQDASRGGFMKAVPAPVCRQPVPEWLDQHLAAAAADAQAVHHDLEDKVEAMLTSAPAASGHELAEWLSATLADRDSWHWRLTAALVEVHGDSMSLQQIALAALASGSAGFDGRLAHLEGCGWAEWRSLGAALAALVAHRAEQRPQLLARLTPRQLLTLTHAMAMHGPTASCATLVQAAVAATAARDARDASDAADGSSSGVGGGAAGHGSLSGGGSAAWLGAGRARLLADCARLGHPLRRRELAELQVADASGLMELPAPAMIDALWGLVKYEQPVDELLEVMPGADVAVPSSPVLQRLRSSLYDLQPDELIRLLGVLSASGAHLSPAPLRRPRSSYGLVALGPQWRGAVAEALTRQLPSFTAPQLEGLMAELVKLHFSVDEKRAAESGSTVHDALLAAVQSRLSHWAPVSIAGVVQALARLQVLAEGAWCDLALRAFLYNHQPYSKRTAKVNGALVLPDDPASGDRLVASSSGRSGTGFNRSRAGSSTVRATPQRRASSGGDSSTSSATRGTASSTVDGASSGTGAARGEELAQAAALLLCSLPHLMPPGTVRWRWAALNAGGLEALAAAVAPHLRRAGPTELLMIVQGWASLQFYPGRDFMRWHSIACQKQGDAFLAEQLMRLKAACRALGAMPRGKLYERVKKAKLRLRTMAASRERRRLKRRAAIARTAALEGSGG